MIELSADANPASRSRLLAIAMAAYAALMTFWLIAHWQNAAIVGVVCDWVPLPADLAALLAIGALLHSGTGMDGLRRTGWRLVMSVVAVNLIANALWARLDGSPPVWRFLTDSLYQLSYPLMTGALAMFFRSHGGSFRRPQLWLDAVTVLLGVVAILWAFLYLQPIQGGVYHGMSVATKVLYTSGIAITATMTMLLFMRVMEDGAQRSVLLLIAAVSVSLGVDLAWLAGDVGGSPVLGLIYNMGDVLFEILINMGDVVFCALIAFAAAAQRHASRATHPTAARHRAYSILPSLTVLLAIALFAGSLAVRQGVDRPMLIGLVLLGAVLLMARQQGVGRELRRLDRALGARETEARLIELVRRSADLIVVVDGRGNLGFVSPAAQRVLGRSAAELHGSPASRLLGLAHEAALDAFFAQLMIGEAAEMEARITTPGDELRTLQIVGSDQRANPLIGGLTLTVRDVTEQRALEREVLDIATRERQRLADDVHEGLSQDLAGISLLLKSASTSTAPDARSLQLSLEDIVGHLNKAIGALGMLAIRLSPLKVVRGSLTAALTRLAADFSTRLPATVQFDAAFEEERIDDGAADHLYRIVQDLMAQALLDDRCRAVRVALRTDRSQLTLTFTDSGEAPRPEQAWRRSLGLKLMEYRVRLLGGALRLERLPGGDNQFVVSVPLQPLQRSA